MAFLPISPLSPELALVKPIGAAEPRLGPIPNVPDGIPGIGGIGRVEVPGIGVFPAPGLGGLPGPQVPPITFPAPGVSLSPGTAPAPEVTPFQPSPTMTPTPGPATVPVPTPTPGPSFYPSPTSTPTPVQTPIPLQQSGQGSPYATEPITTTQIPGLVQTPVAGSTQAQAGAAAPVAANTAAQTFGQYLKDAVSNFNSVQGQADSMIQRLATGDKVDIHDVTLAVQKAAITNQLAIQVRNRLVEAYQEVMRMQM